MTKIRVWLSHDGYRDPDDNLAQLVGAAQARTVAKSTADVAVAGLIFGDATDGGQYHMYYPARPTPARMDGDPRFDDVAKNKVAAGNYAFFQKYGKAAIKQMAPGWQVIDSVQGEVERTWNYHPTSINGLSKASRELFTDIRAAINKGGNANTKEVVVYSAGGGAHVAAEAIALLRHQGFGEAVIVKHFAIVQHGRTNFALNLEPEARNITRAYTIPISKQDLDVYTNGMSGPGLGKLARGGTYLDGSGFGDKMALALDVAQGLRPFQNLGANKTFKKTTDGSDAGSHAFAVDKSALLAHWWDRLKPGETLPSATGREHQVEKADGGHRLRVIYDDFTWQDARALMNRSHAAALDGAPETSAQTAAQTAVQAKAVAAPDGDAVAGATLAATTATAAAAAKGTPATGAAIEPLRLGDADVFAFRADGTAVAAVAADGKVGVPGLGADNDIERAGDRSEKLLVDLGEATHAVEVRLAGVSAREAAEISGYAADGTLVETVLVARNGRTTVTFDDEVRYATIEAAAWQGDGPLPEGNPDLSLVWIDPL